jgi:hypothetical protein
MPTASELEHDRPAPNGGGLNPIVIVVVLLLAGQLVAANTLIKGVGPSDSVVYNTIWVHEFVAALQRGDWPPRWLAGAFQGLGAPSFYYYPPLAFHVAAVVDFVSGHKLDALHVTAWACFALSLASGGGMFAWLRERAGDRWALVAAVAYMVAPYHTVDFYMRGAFAELAAAAVLPWVLLGLDRAASSWRAIPGLALAYAALALSHLPSALLVSLIIIPVMVGWRVWTAAPSEKVWAERLAIAGRCLVGGVLGLALAAGYLGPALLMQGAAQMNWLWANDAASWGLLAWDRWPSANFMKIVALSSWAAGAAGLAALLAAFDAPRREAAVPAMVFGVLAVLATLLHATPWVWKLQLLSQVQFSYRIIVVSEFAAVTAIALAAASGRPRRLLALLSVPAVLAGWALVLAWPTLRAVTFYPVDPVGQSLIAAGRVPNEHLPMGYATYYPDFTDPNLVSGFPERPLVDAGPSGKVLAATGFPDGSVAMDLALPAPAKVVVKRFYFPTWHAERVDGRVKTPLKAQADGPWRFVSFEAQAGRHIYRIRQVPTPVERASDAVALVALLAIAGLLIGPAVVRRRRIRQEKTETAIGTR